MGVSRIYLLVIILIFSMQLILIPGYAATIHGSVYNVLLEKESDVRIEVNTSPKQVMISKDGDYTFNIIDGEYAINAYTNNGYASENITIIGDGEYIIDIVLEPTFGEDIGDIDTFDVSTQDPVSRTTNYLPIIIGAALIILVSILILILMIFKGNYAKNSTKTTGKITTIKTNNYARDMPVDLQNKNSGLSSISNTDKEFTDVYKSQALTFIRKNIRTTQKDLRKELPLSEAKISLIVTELEHDGRIKKIKKGRGNILVYIK